MLQEQSAPAGELLLPTQHFCHPLREALPYFSFSSGQKFPEPLEVPISISESLWGALQMAGSPWHPPAVGSALRQACAVQWLKGKTETPLLPATFWASCSRGHPVASTTSRGPTGEEAQVGGGLCKARGCHCWCWHPAWRGKEVQKERISEKKETTESLEK